MRLATVVAFAALLAGCGGGGGGDGAAGGDAGSLAASSTLAQSCAAPRPAGTIDPFTGAPYGDSPGSLDSEKSFLRSWIDETYLWYRDVRALPAATLDPAGYATPKSYFAVLKSPLATPSGAKKDQFHFTYDTPQWVALAQAGVSYGYGFQIALVAPTPPRSAIVAFTDPGTPGAMAGIARGASIVSVDGVDLVGGADTATLNAGLFPSAPGAHSFGIRDYGNTSIRTVTLTAQSLPEVPVQNVKTLPAPNDHVGYLLFNDHVATSEALLVNGIAALKAAGVSDLVLDLRYNGGGYLDIASELAYMIAGPASTSGKFFERLAFNDRNPFNRSAADATTPFHATSQGFSANVPTGTALPTLGLSRVFVLTSADTCSASEAIVNGLRGAGVTVHLVGGTTCGKPYGFYPRDNCGTTYFAIQFQGVNNLGFGDYADGFAPTCAANDDFGHALGDPAEALLSLALGYRASGTCVPATGIAPSPLSKQRGLTPRPVLVRNAFQENRIYRTR